MAEGGFVLFLSSFFNDQETDRSPEERYKLNFIIRQDKSFEGKWWSLSSAPGSIILPQAHETSSSVQLKSIAEVSRGLYNR